MHKNPDHTLNQHCPCGVGAEDVEDEADDVDGEGS